MPVAPNTSSPVGCIESKPSKQSVLLGGKYINISAISRSQHMDHSYLSRILSGDRVASLHYYRKIAAVLGMTLQDLVDAIEDRKNKILADKVSINKRYRNRVQKEHEEDLALLREGKPVIPRLPGLTI